MWSVMNSDQWRSSSRRSIGWRVRSRHRTPRGLSGEHGTHRLDGARDHDRNRSSQCPAKSSIASSAAFTLRVSWQVSTSSTSAPPSRRPWLGFRSSTSVARSYAPVTVIDFVVDPWNRNKTKPAWLPIRPRLGAPVRPHAGSTTRRRPAIHIRPAPAACRRTSPSQPCPRRPRNSTVHIQHDVGRVRTSSHCIPRARCRRIRRPRSALCSIVPSRRRERRSVTPMPPERLLTLSQ